MHETIEVVNKTEGLLKIEVSTDLVTHSKLSECPELWQDILSDIRLRLRTLNLQAPN